MKTMERPMAVGYLALCLLGTSLCIVGTAGAVARGVAEEPAPVMVVSPTYEVQEWERVIEMPVYVDQAPAPEPEADQAPEARYPLTNSERDLLERVVEAESGGEGYDGQLLVARCLRNACELDGLSPAEAVEVFRYTKARPEPSQSVREAVAAVFDQDEAMTEEPILYFYAPARCRSRWHESQRFVLELGGHRFFARRE